MYVQTYFLSQLRKMLILVISSYCQGVLSKGSGNAACSPLALHCGGKSYLGAQLDKEGGHLAWQVW